MSKRSTLVKATYQTDKDVLNNHSNLSRIYSNRCADGLIRRNRQIHRFYKPHFLHPPQSFKAKRYFCQATHREHAQNGDKPGCVPHINTWAKYKYEKKIMKKTIKNEVSQTHPKIYTWTIWIIKMLQLKCTIPYHFSILNSTARHQET